MPAVSPRASGASNTATAALLERLLTDEQALLDELEALLTSRSHRDRRGWLLAEGLRNLHQVPRDAIVALVCAPPPAPPQQRVSIARAVCHTPRRYLRRAISSDRAVAARQRFGGDCRTSLDEPVSNHTATSRRLARGRSDPLCGKPRNAFAHGERDKRSRHHHGGPPDGLARSTGRARQHGLFLGAHARACLSYGLWQLAAPSTASR
jgi:hypothetical protein